MGFKKGISLLLCVLCLLGAFCGCAGGEPDPGPTDLVSLRNDGRQAKVVLAQLEDGSGRTAVLREIAQKYMADFPNTEVEIRAFATQRDLDAVIKEGQADIVQVKGEAQAELVRSGKLLDFYPYMKVWKESATLTPAAQQAVGAMGMEHAYLIPFDFHQDLLYYRTDWFNEAGLGLDSGMARCRTWQEIGGGEINGVYQAGAAEKMGQKGMLAFAGQEQLVDIFDAMVWSSISVGRMVDPAAGYFSAVEGTRTIFAIDKAANGVAQFKTVLQNAALSGAADWTEEEALEAFLRGEAGMLLADRSAMSALRKGLEDEQWAVMGYPRGIIGSAVFAAEYEGWSVSSATKDQELAVHFLTYLSNADNNTHFAKECMTLPIHLGAADLEESLLMTDLSVELDMVKRSNWYQYAAEPVMYRAYRGYREMAAEELKNFLMGGLTDQELMQRLDEYWVQAYEDEGALWK